MEPSKNHYIKDSNGHIYEVPEENLEAALAVDDDYEYLYDYKPKAASNAVIDPQTAPASDTALPAPAPAPAPEGKSVFMRDKDGGVFEIPHNNIAEAQKAGGVIVNQTFVDPEYNSLGKTAARSAKTIGSEIVGSIPDTATSVYNVPAMLENAKTPEMKQNSQSYFTPESPFPEAPAYPEAQLPLIPSVAHAVDSSIDEATGGYTNTKEGDSLQSGFRTAAAVATPGGLGKVAAKAGLEGGAKVLGALGSIKPGSLAAAGAAGVGTSEATKAGYGAPASIGLGLAAGAGVGAATAILKGFNAKLAIAKLTGNSPKNIDLDAVKAYEASGLPYTNTTVNKSSGLGITEQVLSKAPYFGTKQARTLSSNDKEYAKAVESAIDKVGKRIVEAEDPSSLDIGHTIKNVFEDTKANVIENKDELYKAANSFLPTHAVEIPKNLANAISDIRAKSRTLVASPDKANVLGYLEKIENGIILGKNSKALAPVPIDMLIGTKVDLNDIINWDINASGSKKILKNLQGAIHKDLEAYGEKNPQWYDAFKKADSFYGQRLGDKAFSSDTVRKKILSQENPEKIIGSLNDISDFKALEQSLNISEGGARFYDSIKREKLADIIMGKTINPTTEGVNYSGFSKSMESPKTKELVRYLAGDNYQELERFNQVAKAAVRRNARIPNPSGTAPTNMVLTGFASLFGGSTALNSIGAAASAAGGLAGSAATLGVLGYGANWFTTNKRALQWGIEGAKKLAKGDTKAANIISSRIEREMAKDLGEDFVKQFIAVSNQQ